MKCGLGERVPGLHPHASFHCCGFKNVGLQPPKLRKMVFFLYKFAPKGKFWGSTEKVEYRWTTTNLPVCNDTIIVFKITLLHAAHWAQPAASAPDGLTAVCSVEKRTLLHSVSVITNFVIPKRDKKQTDRQKNHTFSPTAGARPTIATMVIEEVPAIFAPPNFFDPISRFTARGY